MAALRRAAIIKNTWNNYMENLVNEENEWDHVISSSVKEGPADCISYNN